MKLHYTLVLSVLLVFTASGCSSLGGTSDSRTEASSVEGHEFNTRDGTVTTPFNREPGFNSQNLGPGTDDNQIGRTIYFDFDSDSIRDQDRQIITAHARYLVENPGAGVLLEGHTDASGTREYNIGLGDRRGNAVRRLMIALGVQPDQLNVVSYGEEQPQAIGDDEYSYSQNRRVEIAY